MANGFRLVYPVDISDCVKDLEFISSKFGITKAAAIRMAVREYADHSRGMKVLELRTISRKRAEKEILDYVRKHPSSYTSKIADDLRLDVVVVHDILVKLSEKGVVK